MASFLAAGMQTATRASFLAPPWRNLFQREAPQVALFGAYFKSPQITTNLCQHHAVSARIGVSTNWCQRHSVPQLLSPVAAPAGGVGVVARSEARGATSRNIWERCSSPTNSSRPQEHPQAGAPTGAPQRRACEYYWPCFAPHVQEEEKPR
jgi:hypothetical protein